MIWPLGWRTPWPSGCHALFVCVRTLASPTFALVLISNRWGSHPVANKLLLLLLLPEQSNSCLAPAGNQEQQLEEAAAVAALRSLSHARAAASAATGWAQL